MSITLLNTTRYVAQYTVRKGAQIVAALPAIAPGESVQIPVTNISQIVATTVIDGNTYTSAPQTVTGSMGFLAQVIQQASQGTYVFQVMEVPSTVPNQLQFQKTCLNPVTFTISKEGKALQNVVVADSFLKQTLDIGDTFNINAVINGVTTSVVSTTDPDATVTAVSDSSDAEAGYFTLELGGRRTAESAVSLNAKASSSILDQPDSWIGSNATSLLTSSNRLFFDMQTQTQTQWAWAAVATSIGRFYDPRSIASQCQLASWAFKTGACCSTPGSAACNQPYGLDLALARTGNLNAVTAGALAMPAIKAQIDSGRPIALRIQWASGGGGHALVITGYDMTVANQPLITVQDPSYGTSIVSFQGFPANYHGAAAWTHTFTTR